MKTEDGKYYSLDTFDQIVSLWQLFPAGDGCALEKLKTIVNAVQNGRLYPTKKPMTVLIIGPTGKRTHARAFLRALGAVSINEVPSALFSIRYGDHEFITSQEMFDGLLLTNAEELSHVYSQQLHEYLKNGYYSVRNYRLLEKTSYPFELHYGSSPVVLTAKKVSKVPAFIKDLADHIIHIDAYNAQQIEQIISQRINNCGIDCDFNQVPKKIVQHGLNKLDKSILILKESLTAMNSEGETVLLAKHVDEAVRLL